MNEKLAAFPLEGYVLLRNVIPWDTIWAIRDELHHLIKKQPTDSLEHDLLLLEEQSHAAVYQAGITMGSSLSAYELIYRSGIQDIAYEFQGYQLPHVTPLHLAIQIPRKTDFDYAWHIESDFYPWAPEILNFWFPILASTEKDKTGTIEVIPESHLNAHRTNVTTEPNGYVQIVSYLDPGEEERGIQIEADPGDLLVFHKHMVHRTCPNVSNVPRVTGIVRVIDQAALKKPVPLYKAMGYVKEMA